MGVYSDFILPRLCHLSMRNRRLAPYRSRVIGAAEGRVLEIGVGSGLNLPFYGARVSEILALDPAPQLVAMAQRLAGATTMPVSFIEALAEAIPVEDRSVDTVVTTWTLCSIPDALKALHEMRRVMRKRGRLLFVEHGFAPDPRVRWWQNHLTPLWRTMSGGCHLNRRIPAMIEASGFRVERLETGYMHGPKPLTYMYEGSAIPG